MDFLKIDMPRKEEYKYPKIWTLMMYDEDQDTSTLYLRTYLESVDEVYEMRKLFSSDLLDSESGAADVAIINLAEEFEKSVQNRLRDKSV